MMSLELVLMGVGVLALAVLLLVLIVMIDRQRSARKTRLARAAGGFDQSAATQDAPDASGAPSRRLPPSRVTRALEHLEMARLRAGFRFSLTELMVQFAMGVLGLYAVLVLIAAVPPLVALALALILPTSCMALILRIKRASHVAKFNAGLPEALDVFARGLKAGRPVADSLSIVVENASGPVRIEFERCRDELQVGASLLGALERLCTRMPTQDVIFFSVATSLQSETGGNLIETIENLADQLRERRKLKKKARALSSEARASAIILAALPFAVGGAIALLNPKYLLPLITDSRGQIMLGAAVLSVSLGVVLMARMGKLDV